jgi:glycosyltransferase involved in cell wall biosynthesis
MATGTPVILVDVGGGPELMRNVYGGALVEPRNAGALAFKFIGLCRDSENRAILGKQDRENEVGSFSNEATMKRMEILFPFK